MSSNHNVSITITARNIASPEIAELVNDLKGVGTAAGNVNIRLRESGSGAQKATGDLNQMSASATTAAGSLRRIIETSAGVAIGNMLQNAPRLMFEFGKSSFQAASDFNENMNKVDVVFGRSADAIRAFSENAAVNLGLSESAALDATGTFGNLFTSMGMGQSVAADMSTSIVQLAADLGSFNNIGTDEALVKIRAGLVGEIEPLRSLGVNINAVMVQQKAMNMGLADTVRELTAADKAQAAYALILEQTTNAQGDFARTSDGAANSLKTAQASIEDLKVSIGQGLTPVIAHLATEITQTIVTLNAFGDAAGNLVGSSDNASLSTTTLHGALSIIAGPTLYAANAFQWLGEKIAGAKTEADELGPALVQTTTNAENFITEMDRLRGLDDPFLKARTSAIEYTSSLENMAERGHVSIKAVMEMEAALARQAEAAGLANDGFRRTADGMLIATNRATDYALSLELDSGVAAELAFLTDNLTEAQEGLAGAYQAGLEVQSTYNAQASEFAGQASTIEKALEIQKQRLDEGMISQDEYNRFLERGTVALDRYEGGIEDATLTAAEYAIQNAELMRIQDEIQRQFPDLVQGSAEYNQKLEEAATKAGISQQAIDDMKGSNTNLAGVIANELVPALQDLINKILELDGKKATVTVETNFVSTGEPGSIGLTEFAEGGLVTKPTIALIGEQGPEIVVPLNQLPASAKADILGNQQGSGNITFGETGWLPFIESLIGDLETASQAFSTEGLEHAQLFAEAGSTALGTMLAALEFMNDLGNQSLVLAESHHQSLDALNHLLYRVVALMSQNAESIHGEYLEAGQSFAEGAGAGIDAFLTGLELLTALDGEALTLTESHHQSLEAINHLLYRVVQLMAQNAESLRGPGLEAAVTLADATSTVVGAMGDTLSFMRDLGELGDQTLASAQDVNDHAQFLAQASLTIASSFAEVAVVWDETTNPAIDAFAEATSASTDALADTIDFLSALAEDTDRAVIYEDTVAERVAFLATVAEVVALEFAASAARWDGEVNPAVELFAEAASDSLSVLGDANAALELLAAETDRPVIYEDEIARKAEFLATTAEIVASAFAKAAEDWDSTVNPQIEAFSEAAGDSLSIMGDLGDTFESILTFAEEGAPKNLEKLAGQMASSVSVIVQAIEQINADWQSRGAPDIREFAEGAGMAVGIMGDAADAFEAISDSSRISMRHTQIFKANFGVVLDLIRELAVMAEPYKNDAETFLEIVEDIAASLKAAAESIQIVSGDLASSTSGGGAGGDGGRSIGVVGPGGVTQPGGGGGVSGSGGVYGTYVNVSLDSVPIAAQVTKTIMPPVSAVP